MESILEMQHFLFIASSKRTHEANTVGNFLKNTFVAFFKILHCYEYYDSACFASRKHFVWQWISHEQNTFHWDSVNSTDHMPSSFSTDHSSFLKCPSLSPLLRLPPPSPSPKWKYAKDSQTHLWSTLSKWYISKKIFSPPNGNICGQHLVKLVKTRTMIYSKLFERLNMSEHFIKLSLICTSLLLS